MSEGIKSFSNSPEEIKTAFGLISKMCAKKVKSWRKYESHPPEVIQAVEELAEELLHLSGGITSGMGDVLEFIQTPEEDLAP